MAIGDPITDGILDENNMIQEENQSNEINNGSIKIGGFVNETEYDPILGATTKTNPDEYAPYLGNFLFDSSLLNRRRAEAQSVGEQFGHFLGRVVGSEIVGGTIESIGALLQPQELIKSITGDHTEFSNIVFELGQSIRQNVDKALPIYQKNPGGSFNWGDSGWWFENGVSIASSLSMLIPGLIASKTASAILKATKSARLIKLADNAEFMAGINATAMRHAENFREANSAFQQSYNNTLSELKGMSDKKKKSLISRLGVDLKSDEDIAKHIASKSAQISYRINAVNAISDFLEVLPLMKALKGKGLAGFTSSAIKTRTKSEMARRFASMGKSVPKGANIKRLAIQAITQTTAAASEGFEEFVNYVGEQEGNEYGKKLLYGSKYDDKGRFNRIMDDYISDPRAQEQAFFGAFSGAVFQGGSAAIQAVGKRIRKKSEEGDAYKGVEEYLGRQHGVMNNSINTLRQKLVNIEKGNTLIQKALVKSGEEKNLADAKVLEKEQAIEDFIIEFGRAAERGKMSGFGKELLEKVISGEVTANKEAEGKSLEQGETKEGNNLLKEQQNSILETFDFAVREQRNRDSLTVAYQGSKEGKAMHRAKMEANANRATNLRRRAKIFEKRAAAFANDVNTIANNNNLNVTAEEMADHLSIDSRIQQYEEAISTAKGERLKDLNEKLENLKETKTKLKKNKDIALAAKQLNEYHSQIAKEQKRMETEADIAAEKGKYLASEESFKETEEEQKDLNKAVKKAVSTEANLIIKKAEKEGKVIDKNTTVEELIGDEELEGDESSQKEVEEKIQDWINDQVEIKDKEETLDNNNQNIIKTIEDYSDSNEGDKEFKRLAAAELNNKTLEEIEAARVDPEGYLDDLNNILKDPNISKEKRKELQGLKNKIQAQVDKLKSLREVKLEQYKRSLIAKIKKTSDEITEVNNDNQKEENNLTVEDYEEIADDILFYISVFNQKEYKSIEDIPAEEILKFIVGVQEQTGEELKLVEKVSNILEKVAGSSQLGSALKETTDADIAKIVSENGRVNLPINIFYRELNENGDWEANAKDIAYINAISAIENGNTVYAKLNNGVIEIYVKTKKGEVTLGSLYSNDQVEWEQAIYKHISSNKMSHNAKIIIGDQTVYDEIKAIYNEIEKSKVSNKAPYTNAQVKRLNKKIRTRLEAKLKDRAKELNLENTQISSEINQFLDVLLPENKNLKPIIRTIFYTLRKEKTAIGSQNLTIGNFQKSFEELYEKTKRDLKITDSVKAQIENKKQATKGKEESITLKVHSKSAGAIIEGKKNKSLVEVFEKEELEQGLYYPAEANSNQLVSISDPNQIIIRSNKGANFHIAVQGINGDNLTSRLLTNSFDDYLNVLSPKAKSLIKKELDDGVAALLNNIENEATLSKEENWDLLKGTSDYFNPSRIKNNGSKVSITLLNRQKYTTALKNKNIKGVTIEELKDGNRTVTTISFDKASLKEKRTSKVFKEVIGKTQLQFDAKNINNQMVVFAQGGVSTNVGTVIENGKPKKGKHVAPSFKGSPYNFSLYLTNNNIETQANITLNEANNAYVNPTTNSVFPRVSTILDLHYGSMDYINGIDQQQMEEYAIVGTIRHKFAEIFFQNTGASLDEIIASLEKEFENSPDHTPIKKRRDIYDQELAKLKKDGEQSFISSIRRLNQYILKKHPNSVIVSEYKVAKISRDVDGRYAGSIDIAVIDAEKTEVHLYDFKFKQAGNHSVYTSGENVSEFGKKAVQRTKDQLKLYGSAFEQQNPGYTVASTNVITTSEIDGNFIGPSKENGGEDSGFFVVRMDTHPIASKLEETNVDLRNPYKGENVSPVKSELAKRGYDGKVGILVEIAEKASEEAGRQPLNIEVRDIGDTDQTYEYAVNENKITIPTKQVLTNSDQTTIVHELIHSLDASLNKDKTKEVYNNLKDVAEKIKIFDDGNIQEVMAIIKEIEANFDNTNTSIIKGVNKLKKLLNKSEAATKLNEMESIDIFNIVKMLYKSSNLNMAANKEFWNMGELPAYALSFQPMANWLNNIEYDGSFKYIQGENKSIWNKILVVALDLINKVIDLNDKSVLAKVIATMEGIETMEKDMPKTKIKKETKKSEEKVKPIPKEHKSRDKGAKWRKRPPRKSDIITEIVANHEAIRFYDPKTNENCLNDGGRFALVTGYNWYLKEEFTGKLHKDGGESIRLFGKNIQVEAGELKLENAVGSIAIIPRDKALEVKGMIEDGCYKCLDSYIRTLKVY